MNKAITVAGFVAALIGVGLASGSFTPIAYGASAADTQPVVTGIVGTLMTLIGGGGGLWALLKNSPASGFVKDALVNLATRDVAGSVLDAAFLTIAATIFARKGSLDVSLMTTLAELRKKIEADTEPKK